MADSCKNSISFTSTLQQLMSLDNLSNAEKNIFNTLQNDFKIVRECIKNLDSKIFQSIELKKLRECSSLEEDLIKRNCHEKKIEIDGSEFTSLKNSMGFVVSVGGIPIYKAPQIVILGQNTEDKMSLINLIVKENVFPSEAIFPDDLRVQLTYCTSQFVAFFKNGTLTKFEIDPSLIDFIPKIMNEEHHIKKDFIIIGMPNPILRNRFEISYWPKMPEYPSFDKLTLIIYIISGNVDTIAKKVKEIKKSKNKKWLKIIYFAAFENLNKGKLNNEVGIENTLKDETEEDLNEYLNEVLQSFKKYKILDPSTALLKTIEFHGASKTFFPMMNNQNFQADLTPYQKYNEKLFLYFVDSISHNLKDMLETPLIEKSQEILKDLENAIDKYCKKIVKLYSEQLNKYELTSTNSDTIDNKITSLKNSIKQIFKCYTKVFRAKSHLVIRLSENPAEDLAISGESSLRLVYIAGDKSPSLVEKIYYNDFAEKNKEKLELEIYYCSKINFSKLLQLMGIRITRKTELEQRKLLAYYQYIELGNAKSFLETYGKQINLRCRLKLGIDIAEGLSLLHKEQLIHRDIKPQNVLIRFLNNSFPSFEAVICDFGLMVSTILSDNYSSGGTPLYIPPESIYANRAGDTYSYGITLWQIISYNRTTKYENFYPKFYLDIREESNEKDKKKCNIRTAINGKIRTAIKDGFRPEVRENIPQNLFKMMEECWNASPEKRPLFENLKEEKDSIPQVLKGMLKDIQDEQLPDDEILSLYKGKIIEDYEDYGKVSELTLDSLPINIAEKFVQNKDDLWLKIQNDEEADIESVPYLSKSFIEKGKEINIPPQIFIFMFRIRGFKNISKEDYNNVLQSGFTLEARLLKHKELNLKISLPLKFTVNIKVKDLSKSAEFVCKNIDEYSSSGVDFPYEQTDLSNIVVRRIE